MKSALKRGQPLSEPKLGRIKFGLGEVVVRPRSGQISGPGGERKLDPKVMAVLVELARAEGRVVSRDHLMERVWKDVIVTDFALSRCIYQLRKNLNEASGSKDPVIETLPKRGYRLLWPVLEHHRESGDTGGRPRFAWAIIAVVTALLAILLPQALKSPLEDPVLPGAQPGGVQPTRLVVLPFTDLTEDRTEQAFSDGLRQEILHEMASIPGLLIVGRISSLERGTGEPPGLEYAGAVEAGYVLGGSVRKLGDSRRVLINLRRVPEGEQIWSHAYLVEHGAPFTMIADVAWSAASRLQFAVDSAQLGGSTRNLEAFEAYLAVFDATSVDEQRRLLQRAVELDPSFARAWDGLAAIEVLPVWNGQVTLEEAWQRAEPSIKQAMALDPALPDAYITLGRFKREFGDMDTAISLFRKALELDPGNTWASANLGLVLRMAGRFEEALAVHESDVRMDPLAALNQARLGTSNWMMEYHQEAGRHYQLAVDLDPDDEEVYDSWAAMRALGLGRFDLALETIEKKMEVERRPTFRTLMAAFSWSEALGLKRLADEYLQNALLESPAGSHVPAELAVRQLVLGNEDRAEAIVEEILLSSPDDFKALLVLASIESGRVGATGFADRVFAVVPEPNEIGLSPHQLASVTMYALALQKSGQDESAAALLQNIIEALPDPRSSQHQFKAAAYAMTGQQDRAIAQLHASPPGWIRLNAKMMHLDMRFESLWTLEEYRSLVNGHLEQLDIQRAGYLARQNRLSSLRH